MTTDTYTPVNPDIPLFAHTRQYGDTVARLMLGELAKRRRYLHAKSLQMGYVGLGLTWSEARLAYRTCRETYRCSKLGQYGCNETRRWDGHEEKGCSPRSNGLPLDFHDVGERCHSRDT